MAIAAKHRATVLGVTIIAVLVFLSGWAFYNKSQASNVTKDNRLTICISPTFANPLK